MRILYKISREIRVSIAIACVVSVFSSFVTYKSLERKIPKVAVVDLAYLNNDFIIKLSRYLIEQNVSDDALNSSVKAYLETLDSVLKDISNSRQNYILLQKQTVASDNVEDITKELEQVLFSQVMNKVKENGGLSEKVE
jgi:hypothetical protein